MQIFQHTNFDFLQWRWQAFALSLIVIAAGLATMATRGLPMGVEFAGGTVVIAQFEQETSIQEVRSALEASGGRDAIVQTYGDASARQIMIRVPEVGEESGAGLGKTAETVVATLQAANLGGFQVIGTEIVGPAVGSELKSRGIWATALSMLGIAAWMAFRFRVSFAVGSILATLHDVLVTLTFLVFCGYEMSLNVIAAMLTMVGYSMNDMIVIFDRVRENTRSRKREPLDRMINTSLNQTLARTVITSGTVFMAVLALYLFGGDVLEGFAFTMLVGTIATTYSGWFIAPSLAIMLSSRPSGAGRAAAPSEREAAPAPQQPTRKTKPARKARVS
jgi:preprotein translocase subunit SecF